MMEHYLGFLPYFIGSIVTFYRAWLSLQDWQRIMGLPDDTPQQAAFQIACMQHHLKTKIGSVGWQSIPMLVGGVISGLLWALQG